jgi:starvation-inducible DNA-binding protein
VKGDNNAESGPKTQQTAPLATPTDLEPNAVRDVAGALNVLLADMIALYLETKNFHWQVSRPHFRDCYLLLDEQSDQILATTDDIGERVRKIGGTTLRSIGHVSRLQRVIDNDADYVTPLDMLAELRDDNRQLTARMRETHDLCDEHGDVATASLPENWIDEAERRSWFLFESTRKEYRNLLASIRCRHLADANLHLVAQVTGARDGKRSTT